MDNGQRIEMQERAIELLAQALSHDPEIQQRLIRVAKAEAMDAMNMGVRGGWYKGWGMKRILVVLMFAVLWSVAASEQVLAATYYIAATGGSDSNPGTTGSRWATFAHAWTAMAPGDTLIVGNGKYIQTMTPPSGLSGSSGAYTTVQAENNWGVTVDAGTVTPAWRASLYMYGMHYFQVIGIKFASGPSLTGGQNPITIDTSDHIKLLKLAGYNAPCNGNTAVFVITNSSYSLVEDSHAWGCGRYKFLAYRTQNIIFRHLVARHDSSEVSGGVIGTWGRQNAQFTMYDSTNILMQNVIAIDSGEMNASTGNLYGGIWSENNASIDNSGKYEGDIFINLKTGTSSCCYFGAAINDQKLIGTREMADIAVINSTAGIWTDRTDTTVNPANLLIHHITTVNITGSSPNTANEADGAGAMDVSHDNYTRELAEDSIFQQGHSYGVGGWLTSDYNIFYNNTANFGASASGHTPSAGAHDLLNANPGLLYPVRVEAGTPGYGTASDGGNRGATILYRIGTPGTVWGESGYDTLTSTPLWPWADEAVIKSDMASYTGQGAPGVRGFTASGNGLYGGPITLTSYIWESLGNACPTEICSGTPPPPPPPPTSTITSVSATCSPTSISTAQTSTCTATVAGTGIYSTAVTWKASTGTITSAGIFTPVASGSPIITAASAQDTTKSSNVTLTVTGVAPPPPAPMNANHILCTKSDGVTSGHCSTASASTGTCTCQ